MCESCNTQFTGFADMDDFDNAPVKSTGAEKRRYPCVRCAGSGKFVSAITGRVVGKCFTCDGRGYFLTPPQDRERRKSDYMAKKAAERKAFFEKNRALLKWLDANSDWNSFASDLMNQAASKGSLTDAQVAAATRLMEKTEATRAAHKAEREIAKANRPTVDLGRIRQLFETARANHIGRPKLRFNDMELTRAGDNSRNPGAIYVNVNGEYVGKVTAESKWAPSNGAPKQILEQLQQLASDPFEALVAHGKQTGTCGCCGRTLTNPESIALGIGPICRANWGI